MLYSSKANSAKHFSYSTQSLINKSQLFLGFHKGRNEVNN
jgi:hypothetical protein